MDEILVIDTMANHRNVAGLLFLELASERSAFRPHPLTTDYAQMHQWNRDVHVVMVLRSKVSETAIAYGMLRGWDEGYSVPSLGIAVSSAHRGRGLGHAMMAYLHAMAAMRGATSVRLRVYESNTGAIRLYESLGYAWKKDLEDGQRVGVLAL